MLYMHKLNNHTVLSLPIEVALATKEFDPDWDNKWSAYVPSKIEYNQDVYTAIEVEPVNGIQQWELEPIAKDIQIEKTWKKISAERDRRKSSGVKAQGHWFHSDDSSRIQQLALMLMGQNMPPSIQWKTLSATKSPVFVQMTPTLALEIFLNTANSDNLIFKAAEIHRQQMILLENPAEYDYSINWPASFEDNLTQEQLEQFKDSS